MQRSPQDALKPYVRTIWASSRPGGHRRSSEMTLPSPAVYIVIRVDGTALELRDADNRPHSIGEAYVSGIQSAPFERTLNCSAAVGAELNLNALPALLSGNAKAFTNAHTPLEHFWGERPVQFMIERLAEAGSLARRLTIFERFLLNQLASTTVQSEKMLAVINGLDCRTPIASLSQAAGFSHRHFNHRFTMIVGVSPKHYQRLLRFDRSLTLFDANPHQRWADVALDAGYADQSHFVREFRAFSGRTPMDYARAARRARLHLPP